jgi:flagellar basal body rod protein FlgG
MWLCEMMYTRCSTFKCTQDGYIVDADGNHLQGNGGDIQVSTDAHDHLCSSGTKKERTTHTVVLSDETIPF